MSYNVTWKATAEQMLAKIWIESADRDAVTAAANNIDRLLERDPLS